MKKLFTNQNPIVLANIQEILKQSDIDCTIKNNFDGKELPIANASAELWILRDTELDKAQTILKQVQYAGAEDWSCNFCREQNTKSADYCWNCRNDRVIL